MVEPKAWLAASTEGSTSAEVDLTLELPSFDAATGALCAFSALVWMVSVVLAVTAESERSISEEIALIWLAASAEVACSELCASRALFRIEAAGAAPTPGRVRFPATPHQLTRLGAADHAA